MILYLEKHYHLLYQIAMRENGPHCKKQRMGKHAHIWMAFEVRGVFFLEGFDVLSYTS